MSILNNIKNQVTAQVAISNPMYVAEKIIKTANESSYITLTANGEELVIKTVTNAIKQIEKKDCMAEVLSLIDAAKGFGIAFQKLTAKTNFIK